MNLIDDQVLTELFIAGGSDIDVDLDQVGKILSASAGSIQAREEVTRQDFAGLDEDLLDNNANASEVTHIEGEEFVQDGSTDRKRLSLITHPTRKILFTGAATVAIIVGSLLSISMFQSQSRDQSTKSASALASGPQLGPMNRTQISGTSTQPTINSQADSFGSSIGTSNGPAGNAAAPLHQSLAQSSISPPATTTVVSPVVPGAQNPPPNPSAIEKSGSLALNVKNGHFFSVFDQITQLPGGVGGFVGASNTQSSEGLMTGTATLEVPVNDFESVVSQIQGLGKVTSISTKATNVTGQVVDLASRIQALQDSLAQYEKILSQATSIGDVLQVQGQISSIQSQIEQLQGEQNLMNAVTAYSSIDVTVTELAANGSNIVHHSPGPMTGFSLAWHQAMSGIATVFEWLIRIGIPISIGLVFLMLVFYLVRAGLKVFRRLRL